VHGWGGRGVEWFRFKPDVDENKSRWAVPPIEGFLNADAVHRFTKNDQANFRYQFVPWIPVMAPLEYAFVLHAQPLLFAIFVIFGRTAWCYL